MNFKDAMKDDLILPWVNQDPRYWLRLIVRDSWSSSNSIRHGVYYIRKAELDGTAPYLDQAQKKPEEDEEYSIYRPSEDHTGHEYLRPEFSCYLNGRIIDEGLELLEEFPSIPFTPVFSLGMWSNYWKHEKEDNEFQSKTKKPVEQNEQPA
jgi:hypothetical protein